MLIVLNLVRWVLVVFCCWWMLSGCGGSSNENTPEAPKSASGNSKDLSVAMFSGEQSWPTKPLQLNAITRPEEAIDGQELIGTLTSPDAPLKYSERLLTFNGSRSDILPGFSVDIFTDGAKLVPVTRPEIMQRSPQSLWQIIFGPGEVWEERDDRGYARGQLSVTLVNPFYANAHNGLLTFLYREGEVTNAWLQVFQENVDWFKQDFWAVVPLSWSEDNVMEIANAKARYEQNKSKRLIHMPWSALEDRVSINELKAFDSGIENASLSAAGLYHNGTIYTQQISGRYGIFPYPQSMRHGVYSLAKSMTAALAVMHLNQRFPGEVIDARLADYVSGLHEGWTGVSLANVLSMATGTGTANPNPLAQDPFADETFEEDSLLTTFSLARSHQEKLSAARTFGDYPWGPGEIVRYNTSYTYLLSVALDNFLVSKGERRPLWQVLQEDVYSKLGIDDFPMMHTEEVLGVRAYPILGVGIYPTVEEAITISLLFKQNGHWQGEQLLDPSLVNEVMSFDQLTGLPAEIDNNPIVGRRYHLGFWAQEIELSRDCVPIVPFMLGYGANYVLFPDNDTILYRFQDAFNTDKISMLRVANTLEPLCR